jgi:hypothetical protein
MATSMTIAIPPPVGLGRDTPKRRAARDALAAVVWKKNGERRLPTERALVDAIEACDPRDLWWVCEASSAGPVYLLPTREWVKQLARFVDETGAKRVLEVAAGDGFLSACLQSARPKLEVIATDDNSWTRPKARQSDDDARTYQAVDFSGIRPSSRVEKRKATAAVKAYEPDLVIVSWAPPGTLVDRVIQAPSSLVLDLSVEGDVCGNGMRTWRFSKDFLAGPLEDRALCRLDVRPSEARATRATLYYGKAHPEHFVERGYRPPFA